MLSDGKLNFICKKDGYKYVVSFRFSIIGTSSTSWKTNWSSWTWLNTISKF